MQGSAPLSPIGIISVEFLIAHKDWPGSVIEWDADAELHVTTVVPQDLQASSALYPAEVLSTVRSGGAAD